MIVPGFGTGRTGVQCIDGDVLKCPRYKQVAHFQLGFKATRIGVQGVSRVQAGEERADDSSLLCLVLDNEHDDKI